MSTELRYTENNSPRAHYRRPAERPFTASERERTTILIGGLTQRHERFIQAVFEGSGYRCEILPTPDLTAFHVGKEYCNNGQCNPAYFTAGSLIQHLMNLETQGLSRSEIENRYVFFTAGCCGPCRFGMYDSEYQLALENAGFGGFRVLLFSQDDGVRQKTSEPGLKYTLDFGLGMLNAIILGDILNDLAYKLRPYEIVPGQTDDVLGLCVQDLCEHLRTHKCVDLLSRVPSWLSSQLTRRDTLRITLSVLYKLHHHLYGPAFREVLNSCRARINAIALDRLRVKPVVKIVGEFWAQTTEGDGNYRMFSFLEREGAQVYPESIGTWIAYLLSNARLRLHTRRGLDKQHQEPGRWELRRRWSNELDFQKKRAFLSSGEWMFTREHNRIGGVFRGLTKDLVSQRELAHLARGFYHPLARGGEGHLEVSKNIYYTVHKLCHMVLSLKPFGCMPSSMSDGVQSAVVSHFKDMTFLPIETSGEGETNAHSRVQMALGEAKTKAKAEFQAALASTGKAMEEIRNFVFRNPELQKPFYPIPARHGIAGVAANFVLHVSDVMNGRARLKHA
ncbi:MAG TPA: activator of (R)-2-hydroxyglutaryl-CoA dehydratase [Acidobacteriota bacterium]|nr:activator of (R)-2-hydroxyglutaryl-CoA dehydratase [Acidobacteriota bacterium]